jgi:hypothetical protein
VKANDPLTLFIAEGGAERGRGADEGCPTIRSTVAVSVVSVTVIVSTSEGSSRYGTAPVGVMVWNYRR